MQTYTHAHTGECTCMYTLLYMMQSMPFLRTYNYGVLLQAGYRSAVVCVTLLDRLNGDQVEPFHYTTDSLCLWPLIVCGRHVYVYTCTCVHVYIQCTCKLATDSLWSTCNEATDINI